MKKTCSLFSVLTFLAILSMWSCQKPISQQEAVTDTAINTLSEDEKVAGWELLFDGSTLNGWKRYNQDTIGPLWTVKEGMIVCDGTGFGEGTANVGGSLVTTRQFGNFELTTEWKLSSGGNSGILYHVIEDSLYKHDYETGPENQVIDDNGWEGELREAQKSGSNYDMFEAPPTKKLMPVGEWNTAKIVYNNGHVEHWLNGEKVVEFEEDSDAYKERYKKSKWVDYPGWNKSKTGSISLQDHGAAVYYRNLKIRAL